MSPQEEKYYSEALNKIWLHKGDIKELPREWGIRLLSHIPRASLEFEGYVAKGGEAVIILALDRINQKRVIWKFALPQMTKSSGFFQRSYYKHEKQLKKDLVSRGIIKKNELVTEFSARFTRGYSIHKQLFTIYKKKNLSDFGLIPEPLQFSAGKKLGYAMEHMPGMGLMEWCRDNNKYDRLVLFYKQLLLIEKLLHDNQVIHRDINPRNWLVLENKPVLLDFTIAKNLSDKDLDITHVGTMLGSKVFSSPRQMRSAKFANYSFDIFSLGCTFWTMMVGNIPKPLDVENYKPWDLFPIDALDPLSFQHPFERATTGDDEHTYKDITEFREDVEKLVEKFSENKSYEETDAGREKGGIGFVIPRDWEDLVEDKKYVSTIGFFLKGLEELCKD